MKRKQPFVGIDKEEEMTRSKVATDVPYLTFEYDLEQEKGEI